MRPLLGLALALILVAASKANADPALVRSGVVEGQGWVFRSSSGCWLATAGHVVQDSGVIVIGAGGLQAEGIETVRRADIDIALVRLAGALAKECPASSLGDRDSRPLLARVLHEGREVSMERRMAAQVGASGTDFIQVQIVAVSETDPSFTVRPIRSGEDSIVQSDSGSPIRMTGNGVGEGGLPLGLIVEDLGHGYARAIRMDAIRAVAESLSPARLEAKGAAADRHVEIIEFSGETFDTACGPLVLSRPAGDCGWRVRKTGRDAVQLVIRPPAPGATISGVTIRFAPGLPPRGVAIATRNTSANTEPWSGDRYCRVIDPAVLTCELGARAPSLLRFVFEGETFEVTSIEIR